MLARIAGAAVAVGDKLDKLGQSEKTKRRFHGTSNKISETGGVVCKLATELRLLQLWP